MKTRFNPFFIFTFLFFLSPLIYSQNQTDISKIIIGRNYKVVLFDDTEIMGKIVAADSVEVRVETENKSTIIIPKNNILYYTTELNENKYTFSASLMGGASFMTNDFFPYYGTGGNKTAWNLNTSLMWFLSDSKALKIDAGASFYKQEDRSNYASYYPYQDWYTGGNVSMYSFKGNILFGRFKPEERFMYYFSLGFGMHIFKQEAITETYTTQNYPDTTWVLKSYVREPLTEFNALLSLGGAVGYRFSKKFGAKIEMEYYMVTGENLFLFWGNRNYFPLRAGIFYIF